MFMFLSAFHEGLSHPVNIITKWDVLDILWRNDNRDMIDDTLAEPVFPGAGASIPEFGPKTDYLARFLLKTAWK